MDAPPFVALPGAVAEPTENLSSDARTVGFLNDQLGDRSADVSDDGRWLTYEELAEIRGISRASAKRLVLRNGWRQRHDNEQAVRILVPPDRLSPGMSRISAAFGSVLAIIRDAHAGEISALREQLVEARCERDQERERANQAEASLAAERQWADTLHQQLNAAKEALEEIPQLRWQVAEARQLIEVPVTQTDEPHEATGRLRYLLSMLRGR